MFPSRALCQNLFFWLSECSQNVGFKSKSVSGTGKRGRGGNSSSKVKRGGGGGRGGKKKSAYAAADDY